MIKPISLGILITAKDKFSSVIDDANRKLANFETKIQAIGTSMMKAGAGSAAMGAAITAPLKSFYSDYTDVAKKEGELESLSIGAKGIETITNAAKNFTSQFARVSTPEFLNAAYDIKSGISSLSDEGVAKMTEMSSMTAQATKSTSTEMSKLFALGYGVFAKDFDGDFDFAEKFSAAIATSVQAFRTDGSDLAQGLSTIRASAKAMGVSLSEELAVVGVGKSVFNTASEAGTGYKAFLDNVVKAQDKLKMRFFDSKGHLLPIVDILKKIKSKYKDLESEDFKAGLSDAFSSSEAVSFIQGLVGKTDELTKAQALLNENMQIGADVTKEMADKMNKGYGVELMTNRLVNLTSTIGSYLQPVVEKITSKIGAVAIKVTDWIDNNKELATTIITVTGYIGGALLAFGTFGVTMGAIAFALPSIISGIGLVTTAIGVLGKAFLLNPIGLAITVIAVAATLIYTYWTPITGFFTNLWSEVKEIFSIAITSISNFFNSLWSGIKSAFSTGITFIQDYLGWTPLGMIINNWTPITGFFSNLWSGVKNIFLSAVEFGKLIFSYTPLGMIINNWTPITSFFLNLWNGITSSFSSMVSVIAPVFETLALKIKEPFVAVFDWFFEKFQWLETKVLGAINSTKEFFSGAGDKVGSFFKDASSFFTLEGGYKKEIPNLQPVEPVKLDNLNGTNISKNQNVTIQKIEINNPSSTADVEKGVAAGLKTNTTSLSDKEF